MFEAIVGFVAAIVVSLVLATALGERIDGRVGLLRTLEDWPPSVRAAVAAELRHESSVTSGIVLAAVGVFFAGLAVCDRVASPGALLSGDAVVPVALLGALSIAIGVAKIVRSRPSLDACPSYVALVSRAGEIVQLVPTIDWSWKNASTAGDAALRQRRLLWLPFPRLQVRYGSGATVSIAAFPGYDWQLLESLQVALLMPARARHVHEERKAKAAQLEAIGATTARLLEGTLAALLPRYANATVGAVVVPPFVEPPAFADGPHFGEDTLDLRTT